MRQIKKIETSRKRNQPLAFSTGVFCLSGFEIVSDFDIRISDFLLRCRHG